AAAPSFEDVRASGLLPRWEQTQRFIGEMRGT
ncbi:dTDP-4-dehydrorhamnose 3,5-epimerase, partial [Escherichia coli]|nr:dTDP-4-dehydrorhamnose 3,5-epimerase [Escherichia coli]